MPCSYLVERVTDGRRYALKRTLISELSETEKCVWRQAAGRGWVVAGPCCLSRLLAFLLRALALLTARACCCSRAMPADASLLTSTHQPPPTACRWVAVNEVRLLASLHHPNVVQYKQCFVEDSCLHVVMEVVPNGELAAVIE